MDYRYSPLAVVAVIIIITAFVGISVLTGGLTTVAKDALEFSTHGDTQTFHYAAWLPLACFLGPTMLGTLFYLIRRKVTSANLTIVGGLVFFGFFVGSNFYLAKAEFTPTTFTMTNPSFFTANATEIRLLELSRVEKVQRLKMVGRSSRMVTFYDFVSRTGERQSLEDTLFFRLGPKQKLKQILQAKQIPFLVMPNPPKR